MSRKIIEPKTEIAKMDATRIGTLYYSTLESLSLYTSVRPRDFGIDWNNVTLTRARERDVAFSLDQEYSESGDPLNGIIKDIGNKTVAVEARKGAEFIGRASMTNNYIFHSLAEAMDIASKLEIKDGVEFLPQGLNDNIRDFNGEGHGNPGKFDEVLRERMRAFCADLVIAGAQILACRRGEQFGKYLVVKTRQGWFIAYNTSYGEAPYIFDDTENLVLDKATIRENGLAIRIRRDPRGEWEKRIKEDFF